MKVVLYGYYRGIVSSRRLAEACRRNFVFMALSADSRPHFTTIATFVSKLDNEIVSLFGQVLLYASELGLIGKEHFAIDGCKLPSNASKKWSGTHKELAEKQKKLERVAERIVQRHRERDGHERDGVGSGAEPEKAKYYRRKVAIWPDTTRFSMSANPKKGILDRFGGFATRRTIAGSAPAAAVDLRQYSVLKRDYTVSVPRRQ